MLTLLSVSLSLLFFSFLSYFITHVRTMYRDHQVVLLGRMSRQHLLTNSITPFLKMEEEIHSINSTINVMALNSFFHFYNIQHLSWNIDKPRSQSKIKYQWNNGKVVFFCNLSVCLSCCPVIAWLISFQIQNLRSIVKDMLKVYDEISLILKCNSRSHPVDTNIVNVTWIVAHTV